MSGPSDRLVEELNSWRRRAEELQNRVDWLVREHDKMETNLSYLSDKNLEFFQEIVQLRKEIKRLRNGK